MAVIGILMRAGSSISALTAFFVATKEAFKLGLALFRLWMKYREVQHIKEIKRAIDDARKGDQRSLEAIVSGSGGNPSHDQHGLQYRESKDRSDGALERRPEGSYDLPEKK